LPGHLLAGHPQQARARVVIPDNRVLEPAVGVQDLQQVLF
jgi:hypothetical protein